MFGLLTRSRKLAKVRKQSRTRLGVEALEARYCLDASSLTVQDIWSALAQDPVNYPPVISNFGYSENSGNVCTFSGKVTDPDEPVTGFVVNFGGLTQLRGQTATVLSDGSFQLIVALPSGTMGTATAVTKDAGGLLSNTATTMVRVI